MLQIEQRFGRQLARVVGAHVRNAQQTQPISYEHHTNTI